MTLRHFSLERDWDAAREQLNEALRDLADQDDALAVVEGYGVKVDGQKVAADTDVEVLAYASSVVIDASKGPHAFVELLGNVTVENPVNDAPGMLLWVTFRQDATGARTVTFGNRWVASSANAVNAGASSSSLLVARSHDYGGTVYWVYSFLT